MEAKEWIVSPAVIQKSKKQYAHFDYRTDLSICADYVMDPEKIAKHGFYPFIHYEMKMVKYTKKKEKKKKSATSAIVLTLIAVFFSITTLFLMNCIIEELAMTEYIMFLSRIGQIYTRIMFTSLKLLLIISGTVLLAIS